MGCQKITIFMLIPKVPACICKNDLKNYITVTSYTIIYNIFKYCLLEPFCHKCKFTFFKLMLKCDLLILHMTYSKKKFLIFLCLNGSHMEGPVLPGGRREPKFLVVLWRENPGVTSGVSLGFCFNCFWPELTRTNQNKPAPGSCGGGGKGIAKNY